MGYGVREMCRCGCWMLKGWGEEMPHMLRLKRMTALSKGPKFMAEVARVGWWLRLEFGSGQLPNACVHLTSTNPTAAV